MKWIIIFSIYCGSINKMSAWGFWAHPRINRMAVFTLPPEMLPFYKKYIEIITEHSVVPDQRRYVLKEEAPRHYIDLERFGTYPYDNLPHQYDKAIQVFSKDTMQMYGILPYYIYFQYLALKKAFQEHNVEGIIRISAELGHYVSDAHVPLHTTINYNGQFTNQKGIHGFWESRIPELFGEDYDYFVGKAILIENPLEMAWQIVLESNVGVDSVLKFEKQLTETYPENEKYSYENRNQVLTRVYNTEFSKRYEKLLGGQIERRLRLSIHRLGCFWLTAWANAGQPNLNLLLNKSLHYKKDNLMPRIDIKDRETSYLPTLIENNFFHSCDTHSDTDPISLFHQPSALVRNKEME